MEYSISYWYSFYLLFSELPLVVIIGLVIFLFPGLLIYRSRSYLASALGFSESVMKRVAIVYFVIMLFVFGVVCTPGAGTSWKLQSDQLTIKAWPVEKTLDVKAIQFATVSPDSQWRPSYRTAKGMSYEGLGVGWFKLRNSKDAVVFYQNPYSNGVLILCEDEYYFLATPGTEELTQNLIIRGAKEIKL